MHGFVDTAANHALNRFAYTQYPNRRDLQMGKREASAFKSFYLSLILVERSHPPQEDGRWSRLRHGLSIAKEIDEFKSRITKARDIFMVR
jgi:hypothetical protein